MHQFMSSDYLQCNINMSKYIDICSIELTLSPTCHMTAAGKMHEFVEY